MPSIIFVFFLAQINNMHMIRRLGRGHIRIEKRINKMFEETLLDWTLYIRQKFQKNVGSPSTLVQIGFGIVILVELFDFRQG